MECNCRWGAIVTLACVLVVGVAPLMAVSTAGGGLEGRIKAGTSLAPPEPLSVAVDAWACGDNGSVPDPRLVIGKERGLVNVVVTVSNPPDLRPYTSFEQTVIDQKDCVFKPHMVLVAPGQVMKVTNSDRVLHTFRTRARANPNINKAQPGGKIDTMVFAKPEIIRAECDVHYWMSAVVAVAPHAYTAVSDGEGRFRIVDLAPGSYELELWHETLGRISRTITLGGKSEPVEIVWD